MPGQMAGGPATRTVGEGPGRPVLRSPAGDDVYLLARTITFSTATPVPEFAVQSLESK